MICDIRPPPHTGSYMWCGIMFLLNLEDAGEPISFYSREGIEPERNVNYEKRGWTDERHRIQPLL